MADKEKYMIKIQGDLIEVTEDVYYAYFRMERQERWQEEKKQDHDVVSYDALDNGETVGAEAIQDMNSPGMEELVIANELKERLHNIVAALPKPERELIQAIYFEDIPVSDYAKQVGMSHRGINKQRKRILSKLKMLLDIMGSF
jgi:RNA polymerase sigma factor (sigma-70 family)